MTATVVVVVGGTVVVVGGTVVVVGGTVVVVGGTVVVVGGTVVVVGGTVAVVVGGTVVVVVVCGYVVVVVLRIGVSTGAALVGEVATVGRVSVAKSTLPGRLGMNVRNEEWFGVVVLVVTPTCTVVVVLFVVVVESAWCFKGVSGEVPVEARAHTATGITKRATTSAAPGYHSRSL